MIKIYHSPRCKKSRKGLTALESLNKTFAIIKYLDNKLTAIQLIEILKKN